MSADDARVRLLRVLEDPRVGDSLGRALAARFHELMVDEGQDCNPLDLRILRWLKGHGVRITFVCDPGQAIYEFRQGDPVALAQFKESFAPESQLRLTGNFRSSRAICRLSSTLKNNQLVDEALGATAGAPHPVVMLVYAGRVTEEIGDSFVSWLTELEVAHEGSIVLAHTGSVAQKASGGQEPSDTTGSSRVEQVARAVAEFRSPSATARSREESVQRIEVLLLDLMSLRNTGEHLLRAIERSGKNRRELRRQAVALLTSLPAQCEESDASRAAWIAELITRTNRLRLVLPDGVTIRGFFRTPPNGRWAKHLVPSGELGLASATIHQAKGREYDGVCVVIPADRAPNTRTRDLLSSWERRAELEAKRVIYVGVTRAKLAAAIAVPQAFADQLAAILTANQVAFERRDIGGR